MSAVPDAQEMLDEWLVARMTLWGQIHLASHPCGLWLWGLRKAKWPEGVGPVGHAWLAPALFLLEERPGCLEVPCELARHSGLMLCSSSLMPMLTGSPDSQPPGPRHCSVCAPKLLQAVTSNHAAGVPRPSCSDSRMRLCAEGSTIHDLLICCLEGAHPLHSVKRTFSQ